MALLKVFRRKPKFSSEYDDIEVDGRRRQEERGLWRLWSSMYHKVAGLLAEK